MSEPEIDGIKITTFGQLGFLVCILVYIIYQKGLDILILKKLKGLNQREYVTNEVLPRHMRKDHKHLN